MESLRARHRVLRGSAHDDRTRRQHSTLERVGDGTRHGARTRPSPCAGGLMRLAQLQRNFQAHLLTGDDAILKSVVDAPPLAPAERVRVYRNAYRVRLLDALKDTYPVLFKILGDEVFENLGD